MITILFQFCDKVDSAKSFYNFLLQTTREIINPVFNSYCIISYSYLSFNTDVIILVTCAALPDGLHTIPIVDKRAGSVVGTSYTYECLDGYLPPADGLVTTCLTTGEWSLSSPECEPSM